MVLVAIKPGKTEIQALARGRANRIPPALLEVPGGLYPMKSAAFEVDEYRIMMGWPVPVPECDIRIECLVSAEGDLLGNRDDPTSLLTGADMRWVADSSYYDQVSYLWTPIQGDVSPWQTDSAHAPTLVTDYEYTNGDERFVGMTALNFDSNTNDHMWNDLSLIMGGTFGYTVIMVMSPNSIYGNDQGYPNNGLWGTTVVNDGWVVFTVKDDAVYMTTELLPEQKGVVIGDALVRTGPCYLALVVHRPQTTLYAASGPSKVLARSLPAGESPVSLSTAFLLGNAHLPTSATMDMALLDLGIYPNPLSREEVISEITKLSTIYGGDG